MDKTTIELQFNNFSCLCEKARFLIFYNLIDTRLDSIRYFDVYDITNEITCLSPIEQILYIAFQLYDIKYFNKPRPYLNIQQNLICGKKSYFVDFYIDYMILSDNLTEVKLKKPIVIECDGFDFHSSKQQMNKDYARENNIKTSGYNLFRFTGSQIYNNCFDCVEIIYKELQNIEEKNDYEV